MTQPRHVKSVVLLKEIPNYAFKMYNLKKRIKINSTWVIYLIIKELVWFETKKTVESKHTVVSFVSILLKTEWHVTAVFAFKRNIAFQGNIDENEKI